MKINSKTESGMTPMLVVAALAVVIVIVAAGWFVFTRSNNDDNSNNNDTGDETSQVATTTFEGTMFDALEMSKGKTLECDWTLDYDGQALLSKGKIYTTGDDLLRSTATFESNGEAHESNAVIGKGNIFDWYDNDPESTSKVALSSIEGQPPKESTYAQASQIDPNASFSFVCKDWELDHAMYEIPIPLSSTPGQNQ